MRLLDLVPRDIEVVAGEALAAGYRRRLRRYRYGPGVFKLDWALDGPIPWSDARCARAATVHVGGDSPRSSRRKRAVAAGAHAHRPFVILVQPSLADPTRAPAGRHTVGLLPCAQRLSPRHDRAHRGAGGAFRPGFRDRIIGRHSMDTAALEPTTPTSSAATSTAGSSSWPSCSPARRHGYTLLDAQPAHLHLQCGDPARWWVHGMCGWWAAHSALRALDRR